MERISQGRPYTICGPISTTDWDFLIIFGKILPTLVTKQQIFGRQTIPENVYKSTGRHPLPIVSIIADKINENQSSIGQSLKKNRKGIFTLLECYLNSQKARASHTLSSVLFTEQQNMLIPEILQMGKSFGNHFILSSAGGKTTKKWSTRLHTWIFPYTYAYKPTCLLTNSLTGKGSTIPPDWMARKWFTPFVWFISFLSFLVLAHLLSYARKY